MTAPVQWKGLPSYVLTEADVREEPDGIVIPYRLADGGLYAERIVALNGRRWWRPGDGRPVIPYGLDRLEDEAYRKYRVLAITEGESDALALWAALGHEGVDVLSCPGASCWRSEWAHYAAGYAAVYACGDGDAPGYDLNRRIIEAIPSAVGLWLEGGDDLRGVLQSDGGVDRVRDLMAAADDRAAGWAVAA